VEKDFGIVDTLYPSIVPYDAIREFTNRFIRVFDDGENVIKEELARSSTLIEKMGLDPRTFKLSMFLNLQAKVDLNKQCIEIALCSIDMIERYLSHERFTKGNDISSIASDLKKEEDRQFSIFERANRVDDYSFNFNSGTFESLLTKNAQYQEKIVDRFSKLAEACYVIQRLMIAPRFIDQQSAYFAEGPNIALARKLLDQFEYVVLPRNIEKIVFVHTASQTFDGFKLFMRDFRSKTPISYEAWEQEFLKYAQEEREGQGKRKKINSPSFSFAPLCQK
jgi:hypothetical protein